MMLSNRRVLVALMTAFSLVADALAAEPLRARKLDYDSARKSWVELPPPPPGTAEGDVFRLRESLRKKEYREALDDAKRWVQTYGKDDPLYPEVLLIRAEASIGRKNYDRAFKSLQEFVSQFAGVPLTAEALRLEFIVAEAYLAGAKRRFLGIPMFSGEDRAFQILDEIALDYPDEPIAELALKTKADYLFRRGEPEQAELDYAKMQRDYPRSRYNRYAMRRTADAALASFGGVEYDEAAVIEAQERFEDYRVRYSAYADEEGVGLILDNIRELRAEKDFRIGEYYERTDHLSSAVFQYQGVLREYAGTIAAGRAARRLELLGVSPAQASTQGQP